MSPLPRILALAASVLFASVAFAAAPAERPATAPALPKGAYAYWNSAKVLQKKEELTLLDVIGANHIVVPGPWLTVGKTGGFVIDGSQSEGLRLPVKQPIANRFTLGVDINPDLDGGEHQTIVYLWRFCELRYRKSRGELTLNVWQTSPDEAGKELVSSAVLPLPAGKWSRVQALIDDKTARLTVGEAKADTALTGTWEMLPVSAVTFIGKGGADRTFRGQIDHLYLAINP